MVLGKHTLTSDGPQGRSRKQLLDLSLCCTEEEVDKALQSKVQQNLPCFAYANGAKDLLVGLEGSAKERKLGGAEHHWPAGVAQLQPGMGHHPVNPLSVVSTGLFLQLKAAAPAECPPSLFWGQSAPGCGVFTCP